MQTASEAFVEEWVPAPDDGQDLRLVQAVLAGDRAAFDVLVRLHSREVSAAARRFLHNPNDLEDVVQETFLRAYQNLRRYQGTARLRTWLIQIALNVCRDRRRGFWMRRVVLVEDTSHSPQPASSAFSDQSALQQTIEAAVAELPEKLRLPFTLHAFVELSGVEIAEVLGCSESTVWTRIYTARKKLRVRLEGVLER